MPSISRRNFVAGSSVALLSSQTQWANWAWADSNTLRMYVGCFTNASGEATPDVYGGERSANDRSRGVYTFTLDTRTGIASDIKLAAECSNPAHLIVHSNQRFLYACRGAGSSIDGQNLITAFAVQADGLLKELNTVRSGGTGPTVGAVDKLGKHLLTTNFSSNSIVCFALNADGSLGERTAMIGKEPVAGARGQGPQGGNAPPGGPGNSAPGATGPGTPAAGMAGGMAGGMGAGEANPDSTRPHAIILSKTDQFAIATEISANRCHVLKFDTNTGSLVSHQLATDTQRTGPRHLAWHPSYQYLYTSGEEGSAITAWRWNEEQGELTPLQSLSTKPDGYSGRNQPADVVVHPSGNFVYATNRGAGTLAGYRIDQSTGLMTHVDDAALGSTTCWSMLFDPTGRWAMAASQISDEIVLYSVNQDTGKLTATGQRLHTVLPTCLRAT